MMGILFVYDRTEMHLRGHDDFGRLSLANLAMNPRRR